MVSDTRTEYYDRGWLVRGEADWRTAPVVLHHGRVILDDSGGFIAAGEPGGPEFAVVRVGTTHGPLDLVGERTAERHLLLVPAVSDRHGGYTGLWVLVHQPSGMCLPCADLPARHARRMAELIAAAGLDWSRLPVDRAAHAAAAKAGLLGASDEWAAEALAEGAAIPEALAKATAKANRGTA
ncbi:hypothetical protein [Actinokineospora spheciospongiae]|uniref:hypothetical protein n=1 Tax=Actinokineospora spheciospongiae TaxID=909613 RepID=UPI000D7091A6|nr:hypothetical protein [Actinokineospora spheciospongiae]